MKKYVLGIVFLSIIPIISSIWLRKVNLNPVSPAISEASPSEARPQFLLQSGCIQWGETLESILLKHDLPRPETQKFISAFDSVFDVRKLRAGEDYFLYRDSIGTLHKFEYRPDLISVITVQRDSSDQIFGTKNTIPLITKVRLIHGKITTTLYDAMLALNETPELIAMFSDIFQWDIDFFVDPRVGDEFKILYQASHILDLARPDSVGPFVRYDRILAGQYWLSGTPLTAIYFSSGTGQSGYYDLEGKSFQKTFLKSPLNFRRISSHFSYARRHPILKIVRPHYGVDFSAPAGTPVVAAADGIVVKTGYDKGIGNFVRIRHKNSRFETLYGHLSGFAEGIAPEVQVRQRDLVGYVGTTGLSTGPHLHYTFYDNGRPINPLKIKNSSGDPIAPLQMAAFEMTKLALLGQLGNSDAEKPVYFTMYNPTAEFLPLSQRWRLP